MSLSTLNHRTMKKLELWTGKGISEKDWVIIPKHSTPEEIGQSGFVSFGSMLRELTTVPIILGGYTAPSASHFSLRAQRKVTKGRS